MKKTVFFLLLILISKIECADFLYLIKVKIKNKKLAEKVKIAEVSGIFPLRNDKNLAVKVFDSNGKECKVISVNVENGKFTLFFEPGKTEIYKIFIGYGKESLNSKFEKGKILIDDYVPPDSTKFGFWNWSEKRISGFLSHTDREGYSFHRVLFSRNIKIRKNQKLILFVYLPSKKSPEELLIEIGTPRRKNYFFSFGENIINWKGLEKNYISEIPEKGKWEKIEIPLSYIKETSFNSIGFYHDKGKVLWDRISIGEVPVETEILKFKNFEEKITPFFTYSLEGPYILNEKTFSLLTIDATNSFGGGKFLWKINGKKYEGAKLKIPIFSQDKLKISLSVKNKENQRSIEYEIKLEERKPEKIKIVERVLPYKIFGNIENFILPVRVFNLSNIPLTLALHTPDQKRELFLLPGEENGKTINFSMKKDKFVFKISFAGFELLKEKFRIYSPEEGKLKIDGPFLKNMENFYTFIKIPEYEVKTSQVNTEEITLVGDFPETLIEILKKKGIKAKGFKFKNNGIEREDLKEFLFVKNFCDKEGKERMLIYFPSNSTIRKTHPFYWIDMMDAVIYLLTRKAEKIIIASPFPSFPQLENKVYREKLKNLCKKRNVKFFDIFEIFTEIENGEKFFKKNNIYTEFPDAQGISLLADKIPF